MRIIILLLMMSGTARGAELALSLRGAEESAVRASSQYKAARFSAEAAASAASAAGWLLSPRLSLEGSLRYNTVVPEILMPAALGGARPLGDKLNYSAGPSAYWMLDGGTLKSNSRAASKIAWARTAEAEHAKRQAVLKARTAYFLLQLALERVYLIGENLQLSFSQLRDISLGAKAGTRSRLDELRASQENLARRRDLLRARADLAAALRDYSFITGAVLPGDASRALDARMTGRDYGTEPAALFVRAEPYEEILRRLLPAAAGRLDENLPAVKVYAETAQAHKYYAGAYRAEKYPRLSLSARSSLDYPNGPNLYSFLQNSAALSLSLPLFESGRSAERERESEYNARAAQEKKTEAELAARRDFEKALDAYNALMAEQELNVEAVDDAAEAAKLSYEAYKAGGGTWLEVESANLKELQAKTASASTNAEILLKLAVLDSLNGSVK